MLKRSMPTLNHGTAGMWCGMKVSFCCFAREELQVAQLLMKTHRSLAIPGQKTASRGFLWLASIPECPVWIFCRKMGRNASGMKTRCPLKIRPPSTVSSSLYVQNGHTLANAAQAIDIRTHSFFFLFSVFSCMYVCMYVLRHVRQWYRG